MMCNVQNPSNHECNVLSSEPFTVEKICVINNNTSFRTDMHDTGATVVCVCVTSGSNSSASRMISKELPKENISQQQKRGVMET